MRTEGKATMIKFNYRDDFIRLRKASEYGGCNFSQRRTSSFLKPAVRMELSLP